MSDDREQLLSQIGQLAGQINRHKNQSEQAARPSGAPYAPAGQGYPAPYQSARGRGSPYWQPPARGSYVPWGGRGRGRGGRGGLPVTHHHRSLVINNSPITTTTKPPLPSSTTVSLASTPAGSTGPTPPDSGNSPVTGATPAAAIATTTGWVAKKDRHMQLINTAVYEKQTQARAKAIAKTAEDKRRRREEHEKAKINRFVHSQGHEIDIGGELFQVSAGGSKLVRVSGNSNVAATPKKAMVGGVQFQRSRNGNLYRAGLVRATRLSKLPPRKSTEPCKYFSNSGQCKYATSCPYVHNPNEVAICPRFLASDSCPDGEMCDLSHNPTPHRAPACLHFLRGNCSNSNCRYAHVRVNPAASICRRFATLGYCPKGADCTERHVHECPEFDEKGVCNDTKCKLPHIERAGRRRAAATAAEKAKKQESGSSSKNASSEDDEEDEEEDNDNEASDVDSDFLDDDVNFVGYVEDSQADGAGGGMLGDFVKF